MRAIEVDFLRWLESIRTGPLTQIVEGINFTGDVLFFTIMLPIIYWLFSKRLGLLLALTIFASLFINVILKDMLEVIRPFLAHDLTSIVNQSGYSFPSGHSQHSFVFWITIALYLRKRWMWLFSAAMVLLVGFGRMYSGVHYPLDVLAGWIVALALIYMFYQIDKRRVLIRINKKVLLLIALGVAILSLLLYELLVGQALDKDSAYQASGLFLFALIGFVLESSYVKFAVKQAFLVKCCALIFGLLGLLLIKEGIKLILPEHVMSDFIRYGLLAFWTIYLAPHCFVWFRFAYKKL